MLSSESKLEILPAATQLFDHLRQSDRDAFLINRRLTTRAVAMVSLSFVLTGSVAAICFLSSGLASSRAIASATLSRLLGLEQDLLDLV